MSSIVRYTTERNRSPFVRRYDWELLYNNGKIYFTSFKRNPQINGLVKLKLVKDYKIGLSNTK